MRFTFKRSNIFGLLLAVLVLTFNANSFSQVVITGTTDTVDCAHLCDTLTAHVTGDVPINSGITQDDVFPVAQNPIGFTFFFYGLPYTNCLIGPNGNICFNTGENGTQNLTGQGTAWEIDAQLAGNSTVFNSICGPWCDIDIDVMNGGTITYSTDGVAPNRKYVITFCHDLMYSCTNQYTTTQIILYETTNNIEVHLEHKDICSGWNNPQTPPYNGGRAIIGVQNRDGTSSITAPNRDWQPIWSAQNEAWGFTPQNGGASYTVAPIVYAPIPDQSSPVYWYDSTTGAYLSTGTQLIVCPSVTTTYKAAALSCSDTSWAYFHLTVLPTFNVSSTHTNPTNCGFCDGTITLHGLFANSADSLFITKDGVLEQPSPLVNVGPDSSYTLTNLCAGIYSIRVKYAHCTSDPVVDTIVDPGRFVSGITFTPLTNCDSCDGTITFHGVQPNESDTINYTFNGIPQTQIVTTAGADSLIKVVGLCPGIYDNFHIKTLALCDYGPLGPDTIAGHPIAASSVDFTNPTKCGFCNGTILLHGLPAGLTDTVTYSYNGVPQPEVSFDIPGDSTLTMTGLCDGTYTNIVVRTGFCISGAYGPITLVNPALVITGVTTSDVSGCGVCDGIINLHGLPETQFDTVYYKYNNMWQPPVVFPVSFDNTINIVNLCVGEYDSLSVFTSGGCSTTAIGPYIVNGPGISAAFDYKIFYNCSGPDSVIFTNQSTPVNILARWHFGDGSVDTTYNPSHVYDTQGVYQVTLYTSNLPCIDSITQTIDTRHPISAGFTTSPSDTLCEGSTLAFNNTSTGGNPVYYWNFGDGSVIDSIDYNPPGHTYLHSGIYNVLLTERDSLNCIDTATATVYVDPVGDAEITVSDTSICAGQSITFKANYTKTGSTSIQWNLGDGNIVNNQNPVLHSYEGSNLPQSLTVRLDVTNRICPDTGAFRTIHVLPYPAINLGPDTALCPTSSPILLGDLINSGNPLARWVWNTGETTPNISVSQPGLYYSTVTLEGCSNSDSVLVRNDCYIEIPNVFTPNGDGVNDYFFPRQWLTSGVTNFHMSVYNRWGQQIFETTNSEGQGWDGRFNNVQQPEGVYIYMIEVSFKDGKHETHQGNVTILR